MKVTIFQKQLGERISLTEKQKLAKERSDFLLLPQYLLNDPNLKEHSIQDHYDESIDHLLDISEVYKGVILGGSLYRKSQSQIFESVPIIQDLNLVDNYDTKNSKLEKARIGESETIFIMAGVRFSILVGEDIADRETITELREKGISIFFHLDSLPRTRDYDGDLEYYKNLCSEFGINIFRVCGYSKDSGLEGRSLVATPTGIQWKVGKMESDKSLFKTIHFVQANPFL
jgi:predicted amidohydrolase